MDRGGEEQDVRRRFEALLAPVLDAAYGTAYHMTRSREEAEDLLQDAAVQAFAAFSSFQEGTNFKAWFFRIVINRFRNLHRTKRRRPEITPLEDAPELYLYVQTAKAGLHQESDDPAGAVLSRMTTDQIREAIDALPDEFQVVALLYFLEELSYEEISQIAGCPVGTVRSRLHRGRKLLQRALWQIAVDEGIVKPVAEAVPAEEAHSL